MNEVELREVLETLWARISSRRSQRDLAKEEPREILRETVKAFHLANPSSSHNVSENGADVQGAVPAPADVEAWKKPKHPLNPKLVPISYYPLVPDVDATNDTGSFLSIKLSGNPTEKTTSPDRRLSTALLKPEEPSASVITAFQTQQAAHEAKPDLVPAPKLPTMDLQLFLPATEEAADAIKEDMHHAHSCRR